MTADDQAPATGAELRTAWLDYWFSRPDRHAPYEGKETFAAGFAAGLAHTKKPSEPLVCEICGRHAILGTSKGPGQPMIGRCAEHFPEVEDG